MRLGAFEVNEPLPELKEPHVFARLEPWIDAGNVGTLILSWLETHFCAQELAKLARPGDFFDFTRYRPVSYSREGRRQLSIPNTFITYSQQKEGNGFLFLHLLEPHGHSEEYVDSILQLLVRFSVKRYCLIGGMYDYVPHTKPLLVTGGSIGEKAQQELRQAGVESSDYQGPTTITSLIPQRAADLGIETVNLLVHLPQYTQLDDDYVGAVRLIELLNRLYRFPTNKTYLQRAAQQAEEINAAIEKNPQLKTVVEHLETYYEARTRKRREETPPPLSSEVERFLTEMDKRFRETK